jgi:hypothetical protein
VGSNGTKSKPRRNEVLVRFHPQELKTVRRAIARRMDSYRKSPRTLPAPNLPNFIVGAAVECAKRGLGAA